MLCQAQFQLASSIYMEPNFFVSRLYEPDSHTTDKTTPAQENIFICQISDSSNQVPKHGLILALLSRRMSKSPFHFIDLFGLETNSNNTLTNTIL